MKIWWVKIRGSGGCGQSCEPRLRSSYRWSSPWGEPLSPAPSASRPWPVPSSPRSPSAWRWERRSPSSQPSPCWSGCLTAAAAQRETKGKENCYVDSESFQTKLDSPEALLLLLLFSLKPLGRQRSVCLYKNTFCDERTLPSIAGSHSTIRGKCVYTHSLLFYKKRASHVVVDLNIFWEINTCTEINLQYKKELAQT